MRVCLMYEGRDFDLQRGLPVNERALTQDLELNTMLNAMALGDKFIFEVAKKAILCGTTKLDTILYRQQVLKDCLRNPSLVRDIYNIAVEAITYEKQHFWGFSSKYPSSILRRSIDVLQMFISMLYKLRLIADEHVGNFDSRGFKMLFDLLCRELDDEFLFRAQNHLRELKFPDGVLIGAQLGKGNKGSNYVLGKLSNDLPKENMLGLLMRCFAGTPDDIIRISERDDRGARALGELRDRGISQVANVLAQSNDHILGFFNMLRNELAFYIGCLNLEEQLAQRGKPISFPFPLVLGERKLHFDGLYDVCLALTMESNVVGNDLVAEKKDLVIITGANQGGKSTFLRSLGLSQLMMQCGMFVPAYSFCADVSEGVFTHFKREEDAGMNSGKLDEELGRMSEIVDHIKPNSLMLFNESFAATNEREGSEIARQIICALLEKRIKVFFVTHLYEFARGFYDQNADYSMFLRAERQSDGVRTFRMVEGKPLQTSFGEDIYKKIFGNVH